MGSIFRMCVLAMLSTCQTMNAAGRKLPAFRHEAVKVERREAVPPMGGPPAAFASSTTIAPMVLTFVTPSPSATPVAITQQSQIVTSFVPQFTLCALPPMAEVDLSVKPTTPPYQNYSISIPPGNGTCTTIYSPTATMVCATVLSGIATRYTVSQCAQEITFSSQYGYAIVTPTPSSNKSATATTDLNLTTPPPSIQTLTTYYLAPWQELTTAGPPSEVDLKVCATYKNGSTECVREYQIWKTSMVTITSSTVTLVDFTTAIPGPSQVLVETFVANVTELLTTFSLSTTMELSYMLETETTSTATRSPGAVSTGPTVYETVTLEDASTRKTSTTTQRITRTIYAGTTTMTLPTAVPTTTPTPDLPNVTSMLLAGIGA
ncbi:hypothetical protein LTR50_000703 [Elasticomyces elasticus]|nr:hypothetical protein LTR50_000703 [Elasticomyces elasticus]